MWYVWLKRYILFSLLVISITAFAAPKTFTFQTKILKPDGTALEANAVSFQFTTLTPLGTCVLYVEQFNSISMAGSGGLAVFSLGGGTQVFTAQGSGYSDVYSNTTSTMNCQSSGTYVPSADDRRRIVVQFNDGSAAGWQTLPAIDVNSVPFATYASDAEKLSGKVATDFVLSSTLPGSACTGGQVLTYSGGVFSCVAAGTGTVSSVTSANSYLSVATGTTTPVLTVNVGTAANTLAAGNDARIVGAAQKANNLSDLASAATARTNLGLGTAAIVDTGIASGNVPVLDGTGKLAAGVLPTTAVTTATALVGDVTGTIGATVVSNVGAKTAAQVAQSVTDTLAATNLNTASTIVKRDGSGNIVTTSLSTTNVSTQNNYLYDNTNTNKILLKAPNAGVTDYTFTLPPVIGTANQIIGYDAAGTVLENKSITAGAGVSVTHSAGGIQIAATGSGGTVTSVTSANADIGVATGTTTPVLTLNSGTGNNQIVKLDGSAKLPAVDGSALTNLDPTHLSAAVAVNKGGTGATTANAALNNLLPSQATNANKVLQTDGTNTSWVAPTSGTVTSVTSANSYLSVATGTTTPVITAVVGTAANTLAAGDDSRIVNAVQQTAYNGDIANVLDSNCGAGSTPKWNIATDMWTCVAIGSLNASAITAGTVASARLGSGTADATTFLRGDGTWATAGSGLPASGGSAAGPGYAFSGDTDTGVFSAGANTVGISTGGTQRLGIDSSGNATINTGNLSLPNGGWLVGGDSFVGGGQNTGSSILGVDTGGWVTFWNGQGLNSAYERVKFSPSSIANSSGTMVGFKVNLPDSTTGTGGFSGITVDKTGSGTGTGLKTLLDLQVGGVSQFMVNTAGHVGIGTTAPTGKLHVAASNGSANSAPIKLTSGTNLAIAEAGAIEFDGTNLYYTDSTPTRRTIASSSGGSFTGVSSIANSGGNITLAPITATGSVLDTATTASTSSSTGALVVSGGVGVAGNIYAGGTINSSTTINAGTTISAGTSVVSPQIYGSAASAGDIKIDGTSHATTGNVLLATAGGSVGIGTTAPSAMLEVQGNILTQNTVGTPLLNVGGRWSAVQNQIEAAAASSLKFGTAASGSPATRMTIDTAGNVGVGVASPTAHLDVTSNADTTTVGNATVNGALYIRDPAGNTGMALGTISGTPFLQSQASGAAMPISLNPLGGNIGIGTGATAPASILEIAGNKSASAWTTNGIGLRVDAATYTDTTSSGTVAATYAHTIAAPTLAANSATTYTNAATLTIAGAPVAGANVTITSPVALAVNSGYGLFKGGITTGYSPTTETFMASGSSGISGTGAAQTSFAGNANTNMRSLFSGTTTGTLNVGYNYGAVAFAGVPVTTAASGSHPWLTTIAVKPVGTVTAGGATVGNTAALYIDGASTATVAGANYAFYSNAGTNYFGGNVGMGVTAPTAKLNLAASSGALNTAPLKLTAGTNLGTAEAGAIEFDGTNLYFTDSVPTRRTIATTSATTYTGVTSIANSGGNITLAPNVASGSVLVTAGTASTGAANGAVVVTGGVGVGGDIYSAASINAATTMSALTSMLTPQIYGSALASGNVKIDGTSHATKGNVLLATAGGNVGIGTTAPYGVLSVEGAPSSSYITGLAQIKGTGASNYPLLTLSNSNAGGNPSTNQGLLIDVAGVSAGYALDIKNSGTSTMVVQNNGNVGIGTTAPGYLLDVEQSSNSQNALFAVGNVNAGTAAQTRFCLGNNTSPCAGQINYTGGNFTGANNVMTVTNANNGLLLLNPTGGNVGIGTTAPAAKLQVNGQIVSSVYDAGTSTSIDWNNGNNQYTAPAGNACGAVALTNMQDGGTYTLAAQGVTSGTCSFSQAGLTFVYTPANAAVTSDAVYTFLRMGTKVYVSWLTGFQ